MEQEKLKQILEQHKKWIDFVGEQGQRADLQGAYLQGADLQRADLRGADLRGAYLQRADLRGADLRGAYLQGADLQGADLQGAYLQGAYLRGADLQLAKLDGIKSDFFSRLEIASREVVGLYDALQRGRIDGSVYSGECACFVGTIANIRKEDYNKLSIPLKPDGSSPTEKWFLAIEQGDIPQSNSIAALTCEWIEEWCREKKVDLPKYKIVSSVEVPTAFTEVSA